MVDYYVSKGVDICNIDIVPPLDNAQREFWVECDINQESALKHTLKDFNPTHVVHLAAGTGMDVSDISHFKTNFDGVTISGTLSRLELSCQAIKGGVDVTHWIAEFCLSCKRYFQHRLPVSRVFFYRGLHIDPF